MQHKLAILGGVAALALTGYAVLLLSTGGEAIEQAEDALVGPDGEPLDAREAAEFERRRFAEAARSFDPRGGDDAELPPDADEVVPPPPLDDPGGAITPTSARVGFDYAMRRAEKLVERRRRLTPQQWQVLYRETNDAYAALSMVLDAADPLQRDELERAHKRLQAGLAGVRVRGKKFEH